MSSGVEKGRSWLRSVLGWSLVLRELGGLQGRVPLAEASQARLQESNSLPDYSEFSLHTCCPSITQTERPYA